MAALRRVAAALEVQLTRAREVKEKEDKEAREAQALLAAAESREAMGSYAPVRCPQTTKDGKSAAHADYTEE